MIRLLARYSEGLRLAVEHGPTSAMLFEYVYRNTPQGHGKLGRLIDRRFLQLRAWDEVRQRMQTTTDLVAELVARRRAANLPTMILDVAAGSARYLRDLARITNGAGLIVACHDRDPRQVVQGRGLAATEGLARFTFSVGDATDEASYLMNRDPDIILAVNLFPCLRSDEAVQTVIRLAFAHLSPGGFFLCTTLTKRGAGIGSWDVDAFGTRAVLRPPDTIAQWLRIAGFVHIDQRFSQPHGFALIGRKPEES